MSMLDDFQGEMNRTYSIFPKLTGLDGDDEVQQGFEAVATLTGIQCALLTGSASERLTADRYKTTASGTVFSEVQTVPDGAKLVLDTGEEFSVIHAENVMEQGEVLQITVGAVDYGTEI